MWTPDLTGRAPPKYRAIVDALAEAIASGALRPGDRLPTHRDLAWRLGVNVSTVTQAYREATRRRLIGGEVGRGTYVLADSREATLFQLKEPAAAERFDLSTNVPATPSEDRDLHGTIAALLAEGELDDALAYLSPTRLRAAQAAASTWMDARGVAARPQDVALCAGAQQALSAVLAELCEPGDAILVEDVTFPGVKAAARRLGLRLHGVAMDGQGVLPDALERACRATGARVAALAPILQNPTAAVMGDARRRAVVAVARRCGLTIVEDDVYGALTDAQPLAALAPECCIVVGGLSKTVAAGLRFGFAVGASPAVAAAAAEAHATSWALSSLAVAVARRWIEDGTAKRRAQWQRDEIAARCRIADRILGRREAGRGPDPSSHLWLPAAIDADEAVKRCAALGVDVVAGGAFSAGRERPRFLRVSVAAPKTRRDLTVALERLRDANVLA